MQLQQQTDLSNEGGAQTTVAGGFGVDESGHRDT